MSLNDLMIKKKKPRAFLGNLNGRRSSDRFKIFFPDAFEGHRRLGSAVEDGDLKDKASPEQRRWKLTHLI